MKRGFSNDVFDVFETLFRDFDMPWTSGVFTQETKCTMPDLDDTIRKMEEILNKSHVYSYASFPPADIYVDNETKSLHFEFALAGYGKDDISLTFSGSTMELRGTRKEKKLEGKSVWNKGIKTGSFTTKYPVPADKYNFEAVKAEFKDGMLIIDIPAKEEIKPKSVKIE